MDPLLTGSVIVGYFLVLFVISYRTGRNNDDQTFFAANKSSPWYLVAFGMIGATLSGVTFLSVPGAVGAAKWNYLQFVMGNLAGYAVIALVLLPLYYRLNLVSIYEYLKDRYGFWAYKTGAVFFLLSRVIGASLRLYLVALVLQLAVAEPLGIPFAATVALSIALIYLYTFRGGIKTVVWTDTLQTACMLVGAGLTVYFIGDKLGWSLGEMIQQVRASELSQTFFWDWGPGNNFFKQFLSGAFIAIAMTGLDQDMMQKNLTCPNLQEAQRNVFWFSGAFFLANILFLGLGVLLFLFGQESGILAIDLKDGFQIFMQEAGTDQWVARKSDEVFPILALNYLGPAAGIVFILAVIAAAYSSADSALTALTTSFCVDLLNFNEREDGADKRNTRYRVHLGFAGVLFLVIMLFWLLNDDAVVWTIFRLAGYTYGPLLGMFAFGILTKREARDNLILPICLAAPVLTYAIGEVSKAYDFEIGFMILILNGLLTMLGLWAVSRPAP
ncbi:MAG: sodium:solute symporter [Bacteroidota bacterium]